MLTSTSHYIVVQAAGEYGQKADSLVKITKNAGETHWDWQTISDQDKILSLVKAKSNFRSYLTHSDIISAIRGDGKDRYYKVFEVKEIDESIFKQDPWNWEENMKETA